MSNLETVRAKYHVLWPGNILFQTFCEQLPMIMIFGFPFPFFPCGTAMEILHQMPASSKILFYLSILSSDCFIIMTFRCVSSLSLNFLVHYDVSKRHKWPRLKKLKICNFNNTCGHKLDGRLTYQNSSQNLEAYRKKICITVKSP